MTVKPALWFIKICKIISFTRKIDMLTNTLFIILFILDGHFATTTRSLNYNSILLRAIISQITEEPKELLSINLSTHNYVLLNVWNCVVIPKLNSHCLYLLSVTLALYLNCLQNMRLIYHHTILKTIIFSIMYIIECHST